MIEVIDILAGGSICVELIAYIRLSHIREQRKLSSQNPLRAVHARWINMCDRALANDTDAIAVLTAVARENGQMISDYNAVGPLSAGS